MQCFTGKICNIYCLNSEVFHNVSNAYLLCSFHSQKGVKRLYVMHKMKNETVNTQRRKDRITGMGESSRSG